jgi:hypothetical protein
MRISNTSTIALPPGVTLTSAGLHDPVLSHTFRLNNSGHAVVAGLATGRCVGDQAAHIAAQFGLDRHRVEDDIATLIGELNGRSLVNVSTPRRLPHPPNMLTRAGRAAAATAILTGLANDGRSRNRRFGSGVRGLLASLRTLSLLALIVGGLASGGILVAVASEPHQTLAASTVLYSCLLPALSALVLVVSVLAHELGHLTCLRALGHRRTAAIAHGWTVSIAHDSLDRGRRLVAFAGPATAVLVCAAIAASTVAVGAPHFCAAVFASIGVGHLYSLVPWSSDGRMLWR